MNVSSCAENSMMICSMVVFYFVQMYSVHTFVSESASGQHDLLLSNDTHLNSLYMNTRKNIGVISEWEILYAKIMQVHQSTAHWT